MTNPTKTSHNHVVDEQHNNTILFPGMDWDKEMSHMIFALTHVVAGDVPGDTTDIFVSLNSPSDSNTTAPSSSCSSSYSGSSVMKRSRQSEGVCA